MELLNLLKAQTEAYATEQKIRAIKPYPRPAKNVYNTVFMFKNAREHSAIQNNIPKNTIGSKISLLTSGKHSSLKSFDELEKLCLKDFKVNQVHHGKYLLCRVTEEPFYMTGINLLVEDENGEIENICVYNYTSNYDQPASKLFPKNSVLMIKEPYLKIMSSDNNDFYIRVETPSDIKIIYDHSIQKWKSSEHKLSLDELNLNGNQSFSNKDFESAIKFYSLALAKNFDQKYLNNRAAAYLNLEKYYDAYIDCTKSIELNYNNEKAFYRLGKALYSMRQFERAQEAFKKCIDLNPNNLDVLKELERSKDRVKESKTGDYNIKQLIQECRDKVLRHDVADFTSEHLELVFENKKRVLKAKSNINKGTLLIGSKAASITYQKECKFRLLSMNFFTNQVDTAPKAQNLMNLIHKIRNNPFILKQIYEINGTQDREFLVDNGIIDTSNIESVITYNSFQSRPLEFFGNFKPEPNDLEDNTGVWIMPSYLQHSCLANTRRIYFNDLVLVYASEDIKQGDLITTAYVENVEPFKERVRLLKEYGIDKCKCELCCMDCEDPLTEKRDNYILENRDRIKKLVDEDSKDVTEGLKFFDTVKDLYKNRSKYRYGLSLPLVFCGALFRNKGKLDKSAKIYFDLFELCKDYQERMAFYGIVEAINDYYLWFDIEKAKECYGMFKNFSIGHEEYFLHLCDAKIIDYENIKNLLEAN